MTLAGGKYSDAIGRWAGFGPYYAMFPVDFAKQVVGFFSPAGGSVLDPFCGRGTAPFVAQAMGRSALGVEINPVAWVFAKVKTSPEPDTQKLVDRIDQIQDAIKSEEKEPENEFQQWAWAPDVLAFLRAASRMLDWRNNITDRTLMGFILVHLHARRGEGLGNQMQKARAMGPDYAIRWWKKRGLYPPDVDCKRFFQTKFSWRYKHGVIEGCHNSEIILGDSTHVLQQSCQNRHDLLVTSPPYFNLTDYRQDSWIRLWALGEGPALPDWKMDHRQSNRVLYKKMLTDVFQDSANQLKCEGAVWVRSDSREFTKQTTIEVMKSVWPGRKIFIRRDQPENGTQTAFFNNKRASHAEIDLVIPGHRKLPDPTTQWSQL